MALGQNAQAEESLCVYSNADQYGWYSVEFTTSEGGYELCNGSDHIPYTVTYNDEDAPGGMFTNPKMNYGGQTTGGIVGYPCTVDNARITIGIVADHLEAVPAKAYSGTLTMIIATQ